MKILYIHPAYREHKYDYFKCLNNSFDVRFLFIMKQNQNERIPEELKSKLNFEVLGLKGIRVGDYSIRSFLILLRKLTNEIVLGKCDIIITSTQHPLHSKIAFILSKVARKKLMVFIEEWIRPSIKSRILRLNYCLTDTIVRNADACLTHGELANKFCAKIGGQKDSIFVIPHCSRDKSMLITRDMKKKLNLENKKIVLFLSRIIEIKGLKVLIEAFSMLEKREAFLLIAGNGPQRAECQELAGRMLDIRNHKFIGFVDPNETANLLNICDVFVLPSVNMMNVCEGWGLVINEAASVGKPIITTDAVGSGPDLVKNGYNGFIVRNGNVEELFKAMNTIVSNPELACEMGKNSRKIFESYNSYEKVINNLGKAIQHCYDSRR